MKSERTPLTRPEQTSSGYAFQWGIIKSRREKLRQFQCCLCAILIALIIVLCVVIVSYVQTEDFKDAVDAGTTALNEKDELEENGTVLQLSSPSYKHQRSMATTKRANSLARAGYARHKATEHMAKIQRR